MKRIVFILLLVALIFSCDLFNASLDPDYWQKIDDEIAWANAPWVPLFIETGGMGIADPTGPQDKLAKLAPLSGTSFMKYEFSLYFQPSRDYPFIGWQAWIEGEEPIAWWELQEWESDKENYVGFGVNLVKFIPKNDDGTVVDIFVYEMPPEDKQLYIGPIGADNTDGLNVSVDAGGLGTAFPSGRLPGIMQGYPFNVSFQPDAAYPFRGWQITNNNEQIAKWEVGSGTQTNNGVTWSPRNASGTEMSITITSNLSEQITIMPLDADSAPIEVRVLANPSWGTNLSAPLLNRRVGFPFTVEFSASGAWDFLGWKAYAFNGQIADNLDPDTLGQELSEEDISIEVTGIGRAIVKVNTEEQVLLVPLCVTPVRVTHSNPPHQSPTAYAPGQVITITFSTQLNSDTVKFGDGFIQITGQSDAVPVDITAHYLEPVYNEDMRTITITPKTDEPLAADTAVSVTVGTEVKGRFENRLSSPVFINFNVSIESGAVVKNVYTAYNVWALHDPLKYDQEFFQQWSNYDRDRRIRKNADGEYEVTLYFGVQATEDIDNDILHDIEIVEIHYAHLNGNDVSDALGQVITAGKGTDVITENTESSGAGLYYRQQNTAADTKYYKAVYRWTTPVQGIIRLAVLPSGEQAEAEDWRTVVAESRGFITVAFDNLAPGGTKTEIFSGEATQSVESGLTVYNYNSANRTMAVNLNFSNIRDNYEDGFWNGNLNATGGKPRTMDPQSAIEWQWRIVTGTGASVVQNYPTHNDTWWSLLNNDAEPAGVISQDLSVLGSDIGVREVQVRYRDELGKIANDDTTNTSTWVSVGRIRYYNAPALGTNGTWRAAYDGANVITLNWTRPTNATHTEVLIDGVSVYDGAATSYTISGVPSFSAANPTGSGGRVLNGNASDVRGYAVSIRAYNTYHNGSPTEFYVFNSFAAGVEVTSANSAYAHDTTTLISAITGGRANIILTDNITLTTAWTPRDITSRNFYGNGHTVTITSFATNADGNIIAANMGLFGTASNTVIRDLVLVYDSDDSISVTNTANSNIGGIAGSATGNTAILNCIVKGASKTSVLSVNVTAATSGTNGTRLGGIAGFLDDTAYIQNSLAALNVTLTATTGRTLSVGGAVGYSSSSGTLIDIEASAVVRMDKGSVDRNNNCGGIAGYLSNTSLTRCVFSGKIDIPGTFSGTANTYVGGIVGNYETRGTADNCTANGNFDVRGSSVFFLGGVVGQISGSSNLSRVEFKNSRYTDGEITFTVTSNSSTFVGGFAGRVSRFGSLENCHSNARSITASNTNSAGGNLIEFMVGGFSGQIIRTDVADCSSTSPVTVPDTHTALLVVQIGGFTGTLISSGSIGSKLERCFATGDVTVLAARNTLNGIAAGNWIGGLVGSAYGESATVNNIISQCYAAGNVTGVLYIDGGFGVGGLVGIASGTDISGSYAAGNIEARYEHTSANSNGIKAGGLVGNMGYGNSNLNYQMSSIIDSYALGNVIADNINTVNTPVYAGGLVGYMQVDASKAVRNSFARGSVTAQNNGNAAVYAGGLVGFIYSGIISNNAALGASVTAKGANATRAAARIYANPTTNIGTANYAYDGMRLLTAATYGGTADGDISDSTDDESPNGKDATINEFRRADFWLDTSGLSFNFDSSIGGIGGIHNTWNFSGLEGRGFPVLAWE